MTRTEDLAIDDFFSISVGGVEGLANQLQKMQLHREDSPEKDKCGADDGKAIGATISLQLARLSATTCGFYSCVMGAWVSMIIYRRPLMSIFNHAFRLASSDEAAEKNDVAVHLPRAVAQELALAAVLAPWMMSNLAARLDSWLYATGASESKGAVCRAASDEVQEVLSRSCHSKGAYTRLLSPIQALLLKVNEFEEAGEQKFCPTSRETRQASCFYV